MCVRTCRAASTDGIAPTDGATLAAVWCVHSSFPKGVGSGRQEKFYCLLRRKCWRVIVCYGVVHQKGGGSSQERGNLKSLQYALREKGRICIPRLASVNFSAYYFRLFFSSEFSYVSTTTRCNKKYQITTIAPSNSKNLQYRIETTLTTYCEDVASKLCTSFFNALHRLKLR